MTDERRGGFVDRFGARPEVVVRSPGRVNVIGEHTDYNDGWVLPAAIGLGTDVAARTRVDGRLRIFSSAFGETDEAGVDDLGPVAGPGWSRYVRGAALLLREVGIELTGADVAIGGDLPIGAGLSSSASVTLGVLTALAATVGEELDEIELAELAQRVENDVVGVATGLMDQLAVVGGEAGHALLIDCRSLEMRTVPVPAGLRLLVLDSAVPRRLAESGYNQRRAECERAVAALRHVEPTLRALRDADLALLTAATEILDPVAARRARHVITENQRVLHAVDALGSGDGPALGRLLDASHASLRDDYEVSVDELDQLVELAGEEPGVLGARLVGAGFGGSVVAAVDDAFTAGSGERILARYRQRTGREGSSFVCTIADGVRRLPP